MKALLYILLLTLAQPTLARLASLTIEEQAWLDTHPVLKLGVDPAWPPFEQIDGVGSYRGMSADFMQLIGQHLGVGLEPLPQQSWSQVLNLARTGELDLLPAVTPSPSRRQYLEFTQPYLDFPMVILTRKENTQIHDLDELRGRKVGVLRDHISHELLGSWHPSLSLVPHTSLADALRAVQMGQIQAFVGNLTSITLALEELGIGDLRVAAHTPYAFRLAMGVPKDRPLLRGILDKALREIPNEERFAIQQRWLRPESTGTIKLTSVLALGVPILLAGLAVLLVMLRSNRRLTREVFERRRVEQELKLNREALNESQRIAHIGWWRWDLIHDQVTWGEEIHRITGIDQHEQVHTPRSLLRGVHPSDRQRVVEGVREVLQGKDPAYEDLFRVRRPDGEIRHVRASGRIYGSRIDHNQHFAGVLHDVTDQIQQRQALEERSRTLQTILDNAPIGIWYQETSGRLRLVNRAFCTATGISEDAFRASAHYSELLPRDVAQSCLASDHEAMTHPGPHISHEVLTLTDGRPHNLEIIKVRVQNDSGDRVGLIGLSLDVTDKKNAEAELRRRAFYDALTELPNRSYVMEILDKSLAQAIRHNHYSALLFFDLDNFKIINDTLGHQAGDLLLRHIGTRLHAIVRQEDTPARLGGDEFVVVLPNLGDNVEQAAETARIIAEKVQSSLSRPYALGNQVHHATLSIGISLYPMDQETPETVIKRADTAMYRAKQAGRNTIRFFLPSMQAYSEERFRVQNELRHALEQDEFEVHYQPQLDDAGHIIGAECLLRWNQPERGMIPPARFIAIAEESGLIADIGAKVLRTACTQLRAWQERGLELPLLAVNVSPRQIQQSNFVQIVQSVVEETGADPAHLELEFTENVLIRNLDDTVQKIRQLREQGIRFAIDDFGTGYSSLAYLKRLPVDRLKIDRSFVRDIATDESSARIVETVISMARHLKLEVIAEGVENFEELNFLRQNGCTCYQGYFFSRPLNAQDMTRTLEHARETDRPAITRAPK